MAYRFLCKFFWMSSLFCCCYVGHPISSDKGLISQKHLLKPEYYYPLHVTMGVAYSCLKYGVFIAILSDVMHISIQHYWRPWPQKSRVKIIFVWGRVS